MKLARCMNRLGTETAFEVLARAKALEAQGREIIHLEIGEPDFDTPRNIVDAGIAALDRGETHYNPSAGIPALRQACAEETSKTRGIPVSPDEVVVVPGGKPTMSFIIQCLAEPGDEVIYPNPSFPIYESMINFVGAKPVPIPVLEEKGFSFDIQELIDKITPKTSLIIINSPANPTGGVTPKEDLKALADAVLKHPHVMVLSDEIYRRILYEGEHCSIASFPGMKERTIILDGFSKTYAMTGWRLGYGVMPVELAAHVTRLVTNYVSCTATAVQWAGVEALTGPQDGAFKMVAAFRERRDVIVPGLRNIPGLTCAEPKGAFYVFPNIKALGLTSKEAEARILSEAGVAALSGTAFGAFGEGYLRLSYANSIENINKALDRIADWVDKLPK